jgi:rod shape determining protein RodA
MREAQHINWTFLVIVFALILIGVVNLYSALHIWGESGNVNLVWMQIAWISVGSAFLAALAFSDYRVLERLGYPIYIITIGLLAATLFSAPDTSGHKSWLKIGGLGIQPSEFAKISTLIVLARYFANNPNPEGFNFIELIKPAIVTMIPLGLVVVQGDLGSAMFFVLILVSFAWFGKVKKIVIVAVAIAAIASAFFGYNYVLSDYQKARITTFTNPNYDVKGSGYHMMQSRIAIGSGKVWGKGYLKGNINKLRYLPEKHTDFVFPVLAEEWGFAGCMVTLALYFALLSIIVEIAEHARDRFGIFTAFGIGAYIFWQMVINLGGVLGLMPLTGVTLPFLSYGGSSTISLLAAIGILVAISRKRFVF